MTLKIDAYRAVLGQFASGVTVVSAWRGEAADGVTVSAFSALSLQPPLVLAGVGAASDCHALLLQAPAFAVNILASGQGDLAYAFAELGAAKQRALAGFGELWLAREAPVLRDCLARIECRRAAVHAAGDHHILVGEVSALETVRADAQPLVYHASRFHALAG